MSYADYETSNYEGRPIFLYQFEVNGIQWRHTSADQNIGAGGFVWDARAISDDGIRQTGETQADALKISMSVDVPVTALFLGTPPSSPVTVSIYKKHDGDEELSLAYVGDVTQVDFPLPGLVELSLTTLSASMSRVGLRLSWMRACPYALYDQGCLVPKSKFRVSAKVLRLDSGTLILDEDLAVFGDGYFAGGFVEWSQAGRGLDRRGIEEHTGNDLLLFGQADGFRPGDQVNVYPGCLRDAHTCQTKFDNLLNYGGVPHMPGESPFSAKSLF